MLVSNIDSKVKMELDLQMRDCQIGEIRYEKLSYIQ